MSDFNTDELAKFICMGKHSDLPCHEWCKEKCEFREKAKAIFDAGYQRIVWHKVADGDLPKEEERVFCYTHGKIYTTGCFAHIRTQGNVWDLDNDMCYRKPEWVIAWTELAKYEGEK